ncbi:MAG: TldD/PmbA family protein [Symbiobacteriaceae bacterium]|nr:TldD/PmbA family protein [Symbiobacteriaceae bacterium]
MSLREHLPWGASYELSRVRNQSKTTAFRGNSFESIESADRLNETLRLQHQGKLSIAVSSKPHSSLALLQQAIAALPYGSAHTIPFVGDSPIKELHLEDPDDLTSQQVIEQLSALVADLRALDSRLSVSAGIQSTKTELTLETSLGFNHSYRKTVWGGYAGLELVQGDDKVDLSHAVLNSGPKLNFQEIKDELADLLNYSKEVVDFIPGSYPVIFAPGEVGSIINPVLACVNGMSVARQLSPWADKLGQELLDPRFNLVDDGSLERSVFSVPFDSEGTPTRRNILVQNGSPVGLILDRKTGALLGKESTGNASGGSAPMYHHLQLATGSKTLEELISSVEYGMLIYDTMGSWSGNPYAGIVSGTVALGLKIEKGKIVGRVKDCMFTINAFEHLRQHFIDCSQVAKPAWNHLFPHVLLDEVVISSK